MNGYFNAPLGSLDFSLLYDQMNSALHCIIHRAEGLYPMDSAGLADSFVRLHLLPGSNPSLQLRTKTVHRTLRPEFNETLSYFGITDNDVVKRSLRLTVMNDDKFGCEFIGEAIISLQRLRPHQTKRFSVYLDHKLNIGREDDAVKSSAGSGKILVGLMYDTQKEVLVVRVVCCSQLHPVSCADSASFCDPFVTLQLDPDCQNHKFKTAVKIKNHNPEFNEEFFFEVSLEDLLKKTLSLTVYDRNKTKHGDYIGGLQLGMKSKGERLWHWLQTIQNPDRRMDKWHQLTSELIHPPSSSQ